MTKPSIPDRDKKNIIAKSLVSKKWLPWLLAVLIAVLLWVQSLKGRTFQVEVTLPVETPEILSNDEYVLYIDSNSDSVTITFEGTGAGVINDQVTHHPISVSWQETITSSEDIFPLSKIHILMAQDIKYSTENYSQLEPVLFLPHSISYEIDRRLSIPLPVHITSDDSIPARFLWSNASNDSILVEGAASVILELSRFCTQAVSPGNAPVNTGFLPHKGVELYFPGEIYAELVFPSPVVVLPDFEINSLY